MQFDAAELEALRPRLVWFCYQMLGSPFDAEDAAQDTLERVWRAGASFDPGAARLSTWVFRIARNVCIDRLRGATRRALPHDLREPGLDVGAPLVPAVDVPWLVPAPSGWDVSVPEQSALAAEGVRLATTAVLQALPPRQRGVFVLRDVLDCSAAQTAAILDMTVTGVNSALQRARQAVRTQTRRRADLRPGVVEQYARAIEAADVQGLAQLVAEDVVFEMPPVPQWSVGRDPYAAFMDHLFASRGRRWATRPITANGQPGLLLFHAAGDRLAPHTVQVFDGSAGTDRIGHVLVVMNPQLFELFDASTDESGTS